jgi:predicted hotdog family 3-hydroxylacyl-ACP dehydratase
MALHGALAAAAEARPATPGFLASARDVRLACRRLDDLPLLAPDELVVRAERQAADGERILYGFRVAHGARELASGRIAVVLNAALAASA